MNALSQSLGGALLGAVVGLLLLILVLSPRANAQGRPNTARDAAQAAKAQDPDPARPRGQITAKGGHLRLSWTATNCEFVEVRTMDGTLVAGQLPTAWTLHPLPAGTYHVRAWMLYYAEWAQTYVEVKG